MAYVAGSRPELDDGVIMPRRFRMSLSYLGPAVRHSNRRNLVFDATCRIEGKPSRTRRSYGFCNHPRLPATLIPCGRDASGPRFGIQIIVLRAAEIIERKLRA